MARRTQRINLPAPYLKRIVVDTNKFPERAAYPFTLPWLNQGDFSLEFASPITIVVGENGSGKSTLIEAIAAVSGYDEAGGGKGYMPVDHSTAIDVSGAALANVLRCHWLPRVTSGWFFRAESFYSVARYLDSAAKESFAPPPDFLSWSHGEGFIRFFEERCQRQGIYFMDEPESALSPRRQLELLRILTSIHERRNAQVIMATHSPLLMALPCASLLEITRYGIAPTQYQETDHFKLYKEFVADPSVFIRDALADRL